LESRCVFELIKVRVREAQLNSDSLRTEATGLSDRALASWEVVSVVSSIVIAEWMFTSVAGLSKLIVAIPVVLAFGIVIFSHLVRGESLRDLGFRFDNFLRALRLLAIPVFAVLIICLSAGWWLGASINFFRWHSNRFLLAQLLFGFAWGLVQQYVLQAFINRRVSLVLGPGWLSVLIVAVIFAGLHLPNLWVTALTLVAGTVWAAVYQRAPNLFALAVSHSVMTWFVVSTLPPSFLQHLRVGFRYFA
jgi:membrane protease YdiL (CAAX protease family)